jgi:hypothetical protein
MLCGDDPPVLFEQGDLGFQIERQSPWIPPQNVRHSYAWIKGAASYAEAMWVPGRDQVSPEAGKRCAKHVYDQAGITDPWNQIQAAEIYVPFSWFEAMWLENLGLRGRRLEGRRPRRSKFAAPADQPVGGVSPT